MDFDSFFKYVRRIAQADPTIGLPEVAMQAGLDLFPGSSGRVFQPLVEDKTTVRGTAPGRWRYSLDPQHIARLESFHEPEGFRLLGWVTGIEDSTARLFSGESDFCTNIEGGAFSFNALPSGCYNLVFEHLGESLWIPQLVLGETGLTN